MELKDMTSSERSLLLYVETRAVDYRGLLNGIHMNADDLETLKRWDESGFVRFGRLKLEDVNINRPSEHYWCDLSDDAWELAHQERKARAGRMRNANVTRLHHGKPLEDSAK